MAIKLEIRDLTPAQYEIVETATDGKTKRVVVLAGRKFGKTFLSVRLAVKWATTLPGNIFLIAAPEYRYLADETVPRLREMFDGPNAAFLKGESWRTAYHKTDHILTLRNDKQIFLRSMDNADSVRPLSVGGLVAEEFALWPADAWNACVRPTLMAYDAPALFIFTPKGMNDAYKIWQNALDGREGYKGFHYTSWDGIAPKEVIDREVAEMPEGLKRQEYYAEFLADLGGVFQGVRECIAGDEEEPKPGEQYVIGADIAATQDFNVGTVIKRSTRAVVKQIRFTGVEPETVAERFCDLSKRYNEGVVWIDATGLGWGVAGRLRTMGVPIQDFKFTGESKRQLIANLIMAISGRTIRYPDIPELVNELNIYESKQTPSGNVQYSAPVGYHDDCVIGLALAVWGLGKSSEPFYMALKPIPDNAYDIKL